MLTTPSITQLPAVEHQANRKKTQLHSPEEFNAAIEVLPQTNMSSLVNTAKAAKAHPAIVLASKHTFSSLQHQRSKSHSKSKSRSRHCSMDSNLGGSRKAASPLLAPPKGEITVNPFECKRIVSMPAS